MSFFEHVCTWACNFTGVKDIKEMESRNAEPNVAGQTLEGQLHGQLEVRGHPEGGRGRRPPPAEQVKGAMESIAKQGYTKLAVQANWHWPAKPPPPPPPPNVPLDSPGRIVSTELWFRKNLYNTTKVVCMFVCVRGHFINSRYRAAMG